MARNLVDELAPMGRIISRYGGFDGENHPSLAVPRFGDAVMLLQYDEGALCGAVIIGFSDIPALIAKLEGAQEATDLNEHFPIGPLLKETESE